MSTEEKRNICGCHYNDFDPATLEPLNEITANRLTESQLLDFDFEGKSVLDIGCNLGLFSLLAAKRGATRVLGIDITPEFIVQCEDIKKAYLRHLSKSDLEHFNVEFRHTGFLELDTTFKADIVLCYEVLHWLSAQGVPISVSIEKLKALTNSDLLLETPWDASEKSLDKYDVSPDDYNAEIIFRELLKHFENVRILRFTDYMKDPRAKRVLIHASNY